MKGKSFRENEQLRQQENKALGKEAFELLRKKLYEESEIKFVPARVIREQYIEQKGSLLDKINQKRLESDGKSLGNQ